MLATVYYGIGDIRVEEVPDPVLHDRTDAIVRVLLACICGSDLWAYRGPDDWGAGTRMGHEFIGIIEDTGPEVRDFAKGDLVMAPFVYSDGTCEFCSRGLQTSCVAGGFWGSQQTGGGQGEAVRVPFADGTLVKLPAGAASDDRLLRSILPLTDVMGTGHHAAITARLEPGRIACVVGDGAVGLCGVLAARRLGASQIVIIGHHSQRLELARELGATDVVTARGPEAVERVLDLTGGGAHSVLECVGTQESLDMAIKATRPGGAVGAVGVPHANRVDVLTLFSNNVTLSGGVAPVRHYMSELLADVMAGKLDPAPVLDLEVDLPRVPQGYAAMAERRAIKVLVRPSRHS